VPASSTPVGPAPIITKVSKASRRCGSVSRSARSKATRIRRRSVVASSSVLQAGRERLPLVMAEIRVTRTGAENQRVIWQAVAIVEQYALGCRIHPGHGRE